MFFRPDHTQERYHDILMARVFDSSLMDDPAEGIRDFSHFVFPIRLAFAAFSLGVDVGVVPCEDQYF
jgi:hypothetical protein